MKNKKRERRDSKAQETNLHHYNPTSRARPILAQIRSEKQKILKKYGWTEKELVDKVYAVKIIDIAVHNAWHDLFSNYFAWEAVEQVKLWATRNLSALKVFLNEKQSEAWKKVFGENTTPREAIEIIKRDWWPEYPPVSVFFP